MDTTAVYTDTWSRRWLEFSSHMIKSNTPIIGMDIGSTHTLAVNSKGKLFAWGSNMYGQCGGDTKGKSEVTKVNLGKVRIKQVACGDVHSLAIDYDGNLYSWGGNIHGQLGNGNYKNIEKPYKFDISIGDIKEICAKGNISFALTYEGKGYMWPTKDLLYESIIIPVELPFTNLVLFFKE